MNFFSRFQLCIAAVVRCHLVNRDMIEILSLDLFLEQASSLFKLLFNVDGVISISIRNPLSHPENPCKDSVWRRFPNIVAFKDKAFVVYDILDQDRAIRFASFAV